MTMSDEVEGQDPDQDPATPPDTGFPGVFTLVLHGPDGSPAPLAIIGRPSSRNSLENAHLEASVLLVQLRHAFTNALPPDLIDRTLAYLTEHIYDPYAPTDPLSEAFTRHSHGRAQSLGDTVFRTSTPSEEHGSQITPGRDEADGAEPEPEEEGP